MGDKNLYLVTNKLIYNIHFSVRNERKNFRTMLKFIYLYLFCYDELERLNEIDVKFLAVSLTNVFLAFSIYNRLFSLGKKNYFRGHLHLC